MVFTKNLPSLRQNTNGRAAQGVLVGNTLARSLNANAKASRVLAKTFDYDRSFGDANSVLEALSFLETDAVFLLTPPKYGKNAYFNSSLMMTNFPLFPFLPADVRVKIWKHASDHARLIEIAHATTRNVPSPKDLHYFYTVSPLSCRAPPMLHATFESRKEGLKYYQKTALEFRYPGEPEKLVYYNPSADILLFKGSCCIGTLIQFCKIASLRKQEFPRVAASSSTYFAECCEVSFYLPDRVGEPGSNCQFETQPLDILRGINTTGSEMDWGRSKHVSDGLNHPSSMDFYPGMPGIKEIFHVVGTLFDQVLPNQVDYTTTLHVKEPREPLADYDHLQDRGLEHWTEQFRQGLPAVWERPAANAWVGRTVPNFSFVRLASAKPYEIANTVRRTEIWSCEGIEQSGILYKGVKRIIESITGCQITLSANLVGGDEYVRQDRLDIGIAGPNYITVQETFAVLHDLAENDGPWYISFQEYLRQDDEDLDFLQYHDMGLEATMNEQARKMAPNSPPTPNNASSLLENLKVDGHLFPPGFWRTENQPPIQLPTGPEKQDSIHNVLARLSQHGPDTIPARAAAGALLTFPDTHDPIEKHKWWLVDEYSRATSGMSPLCGLVNNFPVF
ncbi:hypothetical protein BKA61DRAFT_709392 [Leptodontidium sp. MPI-SDFR-AT-0119]|nr:hypothetical protein BKA61DRAFT_709392 [Leptodontidium sp. MPI-SDFR-AT-0119]